MVKKNPCVDGAPRTGVLQERLERRGEARGGRVVRAEGPLEGLEDLPTSRVRTVCFVSALVARQSESQLASRKSERLL